MNLRKIGFVIVLAILTLASCKNPATKAVTVNFWHIGTAATDKAYYQGVVDAYTKLHPNVTIQLTILENEAFKSKLATVMQ